MTMSMIMNVYLPTFEFDLEVTFSLGCGLSCFRCLGAQNLFSTSSNKSSMSSAIASNNEYQSYPKEWFESNTMNEFQIVDQ